MGGSICSSKGKHLIPIPVSGQKAIPNSVEKGTGTGMDPYPAGATLDFCRIAQIQRGCGGKSRVEHRRLEKGRT